MQQTKDLLKKLGLTSTEIAIYLIGLEYPLLSVTDITKRTRVKRTTVYHALETLMAKGLVSKKVVSGRQVFAMVDPEKIEHLIDIKIDILKRQKDVLLNEIVPLYQFREKSITGGIRVEHYEGIEGIKQVIEEALYCKSRHWDVIAPPHNFFSDIDPEYAQYYLETRKRHGITARTLWEYDPKRSKPDPVVTHSRNPRYLPEAMYGKFNSIITIFDDKVAFIFPMQELSAVLITSQEFHDTMAALFEGLWVASKKPDEVFMK